MTWLKMIRLYKCEDVPDHILEEVQKVTLDMGERISSLFKDHDINVILSAFNRLHACVIVGAVTEEALEDAAKTEAIGLMRNIEHASGVKFDLGAEAGDESV